MKKLSILIFIILIVVSYCSRKEQETNKETQNLQEMSFDTQKLCTKITECLVKNSDIPDAMKKQMLDNCNLSFQKYEKLKNQFDQKQENQTSEANISKEELERFIKCSQDVMKASCEEILDMENKIPSCKSIANQ